MTGDLTTREQAVLRREDAAGYDFLPGVPLHRYGRVQIVSLSDDESGTLRPDIVALTRAAGGLGMTEELGLAAPARRESAADKAVKAHRPRSGETWNMAGCLQPPPPGVQKGADTGRADVVGCGEGGGHAACSRDLLSGTLRSVSTSGATLSPAPDIASSDYRRDDV